MGQMLLAPAISLALYDLSIRLAKWYAKADRISIQRVFVAYGYMLAPIGLLVWIAFSISLTIFKDSYMIPLISDRLG